MALTPTVVGILALVAQLGAPLQERATARDVRGAPLGTPVAERPGGPAAVDAARVALPVPALDLSALAADGRAALAGTPFDGRLSTADYLWIEATLARLTVREKAAQLVVSYIEGGRPADGSARWRRAVRLVREEKVGGLIVGVGPSYGTASWLNELQAASAVPLLVTADLEWGPGTRLRGSTVLPINMAIAAAGGPEHAYEAGRITGLEARAAGIHVAFAPVADVNVNPENPVINTRSYGSDPAGVSDRVVEFIRGARSVGLITVVKHFPGHGDTETDSHLALPVLMVDRFRLDAVELTPFRAAIGAGVEGVMTAHLAVPALEPAGGTLPATLSASILTDLLRRDMGFGGLVVTDALHMDGVKRPGRMGQVAVDALLAGADILLIPPDETEAIDAVVAAVRRGTLSESRLDGSVRRVLAAKATAGLARGAQPADLRLLMSRLGQPDHEAWSRSVAERSLTLVRGRPGALPVRLRDRAVLAVIYDDRRNHRAGEALESALTDRGARVATLRVSRSSGEAVMARARMLAANADVVIFASYSRALPWKGALGLPENVATLAGDLGQAGALVVSFGDPYLLRQLPAVPNYLLAWNNSDVFQQAVAAAIAGEVPITGRLPIDLPPAYGVGHGIIVPSLPGITTSR